MPIPSSAVSVRPSEMDVVEETCRSATCGDGSLLPALGLILVSLVVAILLAAALSRIEKARSAVAVERKRAADERDAFEAFAARVAEIDAASVSIEGAGTIAAAATTPSDRRLERVRDAYRETVMGIDHYEEEYAEPLAENMAAELGEELATAVVEGGRFTPQVKRGLVGAGREASRRRDELVAALDREAEALDDAHEAFSAFDEAAEAVGNASLDLEGFDELVDRWHRLDDLERRCRDRIAARQKRLHDPPSGFGRRIDHFQAYLYDSLPVTHPVLADGIEVVERLRDARRDVFEAISRRA